MSEIVILQLLLVDKKITNPKEMFSIMDNAVKEKYPIVVVAEGIEPEAMAPLIRNKLKGNLQVAALKAPAFGERKTHYLEDIAILTGGIRFSPFVQIGVSQLNVSCYLCTVGVILSILHQW